MKVQLDTLSVMLTVTWKYNLEVQLDTLSVVAITVTG